MPKTIPFNSPNTPFSLSASWQQQLAQASISPQSLLKTLGLPLDQFGDFLDANKQFSLKAPQAYINKIQQGAASDPLLLQIIAQSQELLPVDGYNTDPVGDIESSQTPGLLHKYHGRVLLITTAACAIHCRYCFRRHFPYQQQQASRDDWQDAIRYIKEDESIEEVILSGGDPLVLSDEKISSLISQLEAIPHLSRLRIHSRLPVVLPDRITDALVNRLSSSRFNVCMVIHANHANEICAAETKALRKLQYAGIHLLNQAVLLKNINHTLNEQIALSNALYNAGVLPYYLHLLDPVQGAAHFNVDEKYASSLISGMRSKLPGFLVPKLVREIAGENSKTPANEL